MSYTRFAIYYVPPEGDLARFGAAWLGWDVALGQAADQLDIAQLDDVTMTPRKYGFHATLKPPFRLRAPHSAADLERAVGLMAAGCAPAVCDGLALGNLGGFLALRPVGGTAEIARVTAQCVTDLDPFRAPAPEAELARRRAAGLTARQEALLTRWGYPYVMEEFGFHMTLTGRLTDDTRTHWQAMAEAHLPPLPAPFRLDEIALVGERVDGRFEVIQRYTLSG